MKFDVLVVGGSFAGLSAAMQLARARRSVCIVDDAQPRNRFSAASHGFFAQDGASPLALQQAGLDKLLAYPTVRHIAGKVLSASATEGGFAAALSTGENVVAARLVLAFGLEDVLPELPGVQERWGSSVLHCPYCHGYEFAGRRQGVLYMQPGSAHQAQLIAQWGPTTLFMDGQMLDGETRAKLKAANVTLEPSRVARLEGPGRLLSSVRLLDERVVPVETLYLAAPTRMRSPLAQMLGCAFDDGPFGPVIRTDAFKLTTVAGVYAAGDIARVPHNATLASADGVMAGSGAHQALVFGG